MLLHEVGLAVLWSALFVQPRAVLALALRSCSSVGKTHLCNGTTSAVHRCCPHFPLTSIFSTGAEHPCAEPRVPGLICVSFQNKLSYKADSKTSLTREMQMLYSSKILQFKFKSKSKMVSFTTSIFFSDLFTFFKRSFYSFTRKLSYFGVLVKQRSPAEKNNTSTELK